MGRAGRGSGEWSGREARWRREENGAKKRLGQRLRFQSDIYNVGKQLQCSRGGSRSSPSKFWSSFAIGDFHVYFCLGMFGFVCFWAIILFKIYMPHVFP